MATIAVNLTEPKRGRLHPAANGAIWVAQILVALSLFFAGASKLAGAEQAIALFEAVGIGQWFRYLTGLLEVVGAVALVVPRLMIAGASILTAVMTGAVLTHLFLIGGSPVVPLVHLVLLLGIGWAQSGGSIGGAREEMIDGPWSADRSASERTEGGLS